MERAGPDRGLAGVDPRGLDLDHDLFFAGLPDFDVPDGEDVEPAVLVELDRAWHEPKATRRRHCHAAAGHRTGSARRGAVGSELESGAGEDGGFVAQFVVGAAGDGDRHGQPAVAAQGEQGAERRDPVGVGVVGGLFADVRDGLGEAVGVFAVELDRLLDPVGVALVGGEAGVEVDVDLGALAGEAAVGERRLRVGLRARDGRRVAVRRAARGRSSPGRDRRA